MFLEIAKDDFEEFPPDEQSRGSGRNFRCSHLAGNSRSTIRVVKTRVCG